MSGFWKRKDKSSKIDADLRASRPEPTEAAVRATAEDVRAPSRWLRAGTRLSIAVALGVVGLGLSAAFGGFSFAASSAHNAVKVVKRVEKPSQPRLVRKSPSLDQYHGHCGHAPNPHCNASASPTDVSVREPHGGTASVTFTVSLDQLSDGTASVGYSTVDGSARAGEDYVASSGTLSFGNGEARRSFSVAVTPDAHHDRHDESFSVHFSNGVNSAIAGHAWATVTINH